MINHNDDFAKASALYNAQNYEQAFGLLLVCANAGNVEAKCMIGTMYHLGLGVSANGAEAVKWYLQALEQGHPVAANNLATLYTVGTPDLQPDTDRAAGYLTKARELGFPMVPDREE